jgi:hypothetical protein
MLHTSRRVSGFLLKDKTAGTKRRSVRAFFVVGLFWALASTMAIAGDCLSHPDPFRLQSDAVQWSMIIARGDECIQGLRGKSTRKRIGGRAAEKGTSCYTAGPEVGSDAFRLVIVGSSMRMNGTSTVRVEVQVR